LFCQLLPNKKGTLDPKIEQEIRTLATKYDEAINKQDAAAVAALYAQDGLCQRTLKNSQLTCGETKGVPS
jgi:ketosteroid isomerase-like protein